MTTAQLREVRRWWNRYVRTFAADGDGLHPMLKIKARHSRRVAVEAREIARDLCWPAPDIRTAEALGLVHDVGRFPQFIEQRALADTGSWDHGEHGHSILCQSGMVSPLGAEDRQAILDGTRFHNRRTVPPGLAPRAAAFLALIRDADKLDVFQVVRNAMRCDGGAILVQMVPHITMDRTCSPVILSDVAATRSCSIRDLRTVGDLLITQVAWIYDLNYPPTFHRVRQRGVLDELARHLPEDPATRQIVDDVRCFIAARLPYHSAGADGRR